MDSLKVLMILEEGSEWTLRGKTGWADRKAGPGIGWFVGWAESKTQVWFFAMNMDIHENEDAVYRDS